MGSVKKKIGFEPSCVFDFLCESYMIRRKKMGFEPSCVFDFREKRKKKNPKTFRPLVNRNSLENVWKSQKCMKVNLTLFLA